MMNRRIGILVVNRFELLRLFEKSASFSTRLPARETTHDRVFCCYRGFDGAAWPEIEHAGFQTEDGLADFADVTRVDAYVKRLPCRAECDVIALGRVGVALGGPGATGWRPIGFDLGYFESEWSHFSVVLNEIIYAIHPELRRFARRLNEHLLLATLEDALEVAMERSRLAAAGADIEDGPYIEPIAIFVRGDAPPIQNELASRDPETGK